MAGPASRRPLVRTALIRIIGLYQALRAGRASPCRYWPTCSEYAVDAIGRHGADHGHGSCVLAELEPATDVQAELVHGDVAEFDLIRPGQRVAAGSRRCDRLLSAMLQDAHQRYLGVLDGDLGEAKLRPAGDAALIFKRWS